MHPQIKDHFYDDFLTKPTKDNFQKFMKDSCGELNEVDFKEQWPDKGSLAKIMLSMGNNGGGIVVFGVEEKNDHTFELSGLANIRDAADVNNEIAKFVSPSLDYEVLNFTYDAAVYGEFENKKFQIIVVHDTPRIGFRLFRLENPTKLEKI